ncbi:hypothetical protein NO135_25785, partial [Clostridioides difficile]|nr:hypothetical protein [Clostridioides difficile]
NGSLIVPWDAELFTMSPAGWLFCHDASEFASEAAAVTFEKVYLPAVGRKRLDFNYQPGYFYSIIEIDELL